MIIPFLISGFIIFSSHASPGVLSEKKTLLNQLEKRKKAFDLHLKNKQKKDRKRIFIAYSQKKIRKKAIARREKARRLFKRKTKIFPENAHKNFINWRKEKRRKMKKARIRYAKMQKELRKVRKMKKYRIEGKKEFDLH